MTSRRVKRLEVETAQGPAGTLHRESQFVFRYGDAALGEPRRAISLTMPPRPEGYSHNVVPPVLLMNRPEGFLLDRIVDRYRKSFDVDDDMNLLALTSTPSAGRVWAHAPGERPGARAEPMALRELLAAPGTEALFDDLVERFATSTALSGVQPKVVVPERVGGHGIERAAIHAPDLIVKAAGVEYPGLPEVEYLCMSMARSAGLEVPECWLSDDRHLFVIRRFDLGADGAYLGFEDMASLMGRHPSRKYEGSHGLVARVLADFCAPIRRRESLERYFRHVVFCVLVENGDAHLKNWGVLYGDPMSAGEDARLAPAYDLVCTTLWIPTDMLALSLGGSRAWPGRSELERFGRESCDLPRPGAVIDEVIEGAMSYAPGESTPLWKRLKEVRKRRAAVLRG